MADEKVFIEFWSDDIVKNEIVSLYARGGWGSHGNIEILQPMQEIFLPSEPRTYLTQIDSSANEFDNFEIFANDFNRELYFYFGLV